LKQRHNITIILLITFLSFTLLIPVEYSLALNSLDVYFTQKEVCNISLDGKPFESLRWELISESDIQLYWGAYDDPLTVFGQYIITTNETFRDPLKAIYLEWNGEITDEGRIHLVLKSNKALTVKFANYTGEVSPFGRPPTTYKVKLAAIEGQAYLVYLAGSPAWGFQFGLEENGTIPLLRIFNDRGELQTSYWITSFMKPYEYGGVEGIGFLIEKVYLKNVRRILTWIYAGKEITVKPVEGWGATTKPFPFITVSPNKVEPKQKVEIILKLPSEAKDFTTNLYDFPVENPVKTYDPVTDKYFLTFTFKDEAQGKQYTIWFRTQVGDTLYEDKVQVQCMPYSYMQYLVPIAALAFVLIIIGLIILAIKLRREPHHPAKALELAHIWR